MELELQTTVNSVQIYIRELLPISKPANVTEAREFVIPDYNLPIEQMREIDGELVFKGKHLITDAGDLGDLDFRLTIKDGLFRSDPFQVRGWAGALIESDLEIDAFQDRPLIALHATVQRLNYGHLLYQAGFAETVKGDLDITLRLSGSGHTHRELLGNINGRLIIVFRLFPVVHRDGTGNDAKKVDRLLNEIRIESAS